MASKLVVYLVWLPLLSLGAVGAGGAAPPPVPQEEPRAAPFSVELSYDGREWRQVALWRFGELERPFGISSPGLSFPLFLGAGTGGGGPKGVIGGGIQYRFASNAHFLVGGILDIENKGKPRVTVVVGIGMGVK